MEFPVIHVKVKGKIVDVMVCWTPEQTKEASLKYPEGFIDADEILSEDYKGTATILERNWLKSISERLATKKV